MSTAEQQHIDVLVKSLPSGPGVYQFYDRQGQLLYIGKAKNLKKRVSSYFSKNHAHGKTRVLVSKIVDIKHIVVESESDALLLENNLVKKHQPRYNVLLKDDKTFPWICIKNERFPRVFSTRNIIKDGSTYFGPYTSVVMVRTILELVKQLYPLRNCNLNLSQDAISEGKHKVCLEYHIGNCLGPCIGEQDEEDYQKAILHIKDILKGNIQSVTNVLSQLMMHHAEEHRFEEAQVIKEKLEMIERYKSKSTVVNPAINNVDVYSIIDDSKFAYVNYLKVVNGAIIQAHTLEIAKKLEETQEELLPMAILEIRQRFFTDSKEIIVPFQPEFEWPGVVVTVPKRGDKKKLLELSERNVKYFMLEKRKQLAQVNPQRHTQRILETMQKDLKLQEAPTHIECFDNSNIQGTNPVAACVVFRNTRPSKKEYRKFNIKTVEGANDFASMEEVVNRRYKRMLEEGADLPQLIVIDGGKGQLNAAVKSLEDLGLRGKIAVIGIAKRLEEIYFPNDKVPIYIDKVSETLKVIQHLRNEAHRFGITFHRDKRSGNFLTSKLQAIPGIGPSTEELLLKKFKSFKKLSEASAEEVEAVVGKAKAKLILEYIKNNS